MPAMADVAPTGADGFDLLDTVRSEILTAFGSLLDLSS